MQKLFKTYSTNWLGHGHGYEWHSSESNMAAARKVPLPPREQGLKHLKKKQKTRKTNYKMGIMHQVRLLV